MFVVDTNVLVYAADMSAPEHQRCRALIEQWRETSSAWFLTWGIRYEFLRVVTHPRVLRRPWSAREASEFLDAIAASPGLTMLVQTDRHPEMVRALVREVPGVTGNLWHDAQTAALMREHGVRRICTRDTDFNRFRFLDTVDPMVAES